MVGFRLLKHQHSKTMVFSSLRSLNTSPIFTNNNNSSRWLLSRWSRPPVFSAHIHKTLIRHRMIGLCLLKQSHRSRMCSLASSLLVYISGFSQIRTTSAHGCSAAGSRTPAFSAQASKKSELKSDDWTLSLSQGRSCTAHIVSGLSDLQHA